MESYLCYKLGRTNIMKDAHGKDLLGEKGSYVLVKGEDIGSKIRRNT